MTLVYCRIPDCQWVPLGEDNREAASRVCQWTALSEQVLAQASLRSFVRSLAACSVDSAQPLQCARRCLRVRRKGWPVYGTMAYGASDDGAEPAPERWVLEHGRAVCATMRRVRCVHR